MSEHIPGTIHVEGREFLYIQIFDDEGFCKVADGALDGSEEIPLPKNGGVIEEKVRIVLDENTTLLGVSYKGDLEGWRAKFLAYCKATHRQWGIASQQKLVLSDGRKLVFKECEVIFEP